MTQSIKRVVVSLDAVSEAGPAIDTAARLAARWRVPLHGLFIEDEELIGFAGLPFARQVTLATGREPLTRDHIEDHFRAFCGAPKARARCRRGPAWGGMVIRSDARLAYRCHVWQRTRLCRCECDDPTGRRPFSDRLAVVVPNRDSHAPIPAG
jgi:hypothetical protein